MFSKLSTLALFASLVSALHLSVPLTTQAGASIAIDVATTTGDPTQIGLVLAGTGFGLVLVHVVDVAASIDVVIPTTHIPAGPGYVIAAIEVGNPTIIYAESNAFEIEAVAVH